MTDLASPPSARRLASMLGRRHCVWMASPSVALLSALVAGKARPRRLLIDEAAPAFVSNIGRVAGATLLTAGIDGVNALLEKTLEAEGMSPDSVWAVGIHASGRLAAGDWLWRSASHGIPTIEMCVGSLGPLMRQGVSAATFTIVDLDAEDRFKGVGLAGLLTDDQDLVTRLEQFCLPGPEAKNYVLNASPRGLDADEPALVRLLDEIATRARATSDDPAAAPEGASPAPGFLSMRPFQGGTSGSADLEGRWAARLAEAEARHEDAFRAATEAAALLQSQLHAQQSHVDEWQRRCEVAEREVSDRNARPLVPVVDVEAQRERARILLEKESADRELATTKAELDALNRKLIRAERERDLALLDAGAREEAERSGLAESRKRVEQLEREAAAAAAREAKRAAEAEAGISELTARITRLEADAVVVSRSREKTLTQKAQSEEALALLRAESEALITRLRSAEADRDQARAEALQREETLRAELAEQRQRGDEFEKEVGELTSFATKASREWNLTRADLSSRIEQIQSELDRSVQDRDLAWAEAEKSDEAHRASLLEQEQRADEGEKALEEHKALAGRLTEEWSQVKADLTDRLTKAETAAGELVRKNVDIGRSLADARRERETLAATLAQMEKDRDAVAAQAVADEKALRASLDEEKQRAEKLEQEAAAHKERADKLTTEWSVGQIRLTEQISRLETAGIDAAEANAAIRAQKAEIEQALAQLRPEKDSLADRLLKAEEREAKLAASLREETQRAAQLEKDSETQTVIAAEAAHAMTLQLVHAEKDRDERLAEAAAREAEQLREWSVARTELQDQIARLEAASVRLENVNTDLATQKAAAEQALLADQDEKKALATTLREVEKSRDAALAEAEEREPARGTLLDEQKQRADQLEAEVAAHKARESARTGEWSRSRAELLEKIAGLEATAVASENANTDLQNQKTQMEEALSSLQADLDAQTARLSNTEEAREEALAEALAEAEGRLKDQAAALNEARAQAGELAAEIAAQKAREAEQAEAWSAARAEFIERIARLETAAVATENSTSDLVAAKAELERSLKALRAESEELETMLAEVESERDAARTEARRLEEESGPELGQERERAENPLAEVKSLRDREMELTEEWSTARAGLAERVAELEESVATAEERTAKALGEKEEAERVLAESLAARESGSTELHEAARERDQRLAEAEERDAAQRLAIETQKARVAELEKEVAAWNDRELVQIREWAELRADLSDRIARLEANEAMADKARTELLNRKGEAEQASARAESEKAAIARRFEAVERARDRAQAKVRTYETAHQELIARGASAQEWKSRFMRAVHDDEGDTRHTGPLTKLMAGWSDISAENPQRRVTRIVEESSGSSLGNYIDQPLSIDEPVFPDKSADVPSAGAPESAAEKEQKPERRGRKRKAPETPETPPEAESPGEANQEGAEPQGWLRGLAKRIRGG